MVIPKHREKQGVRTYVLLVISVALVIVIITGLSQFLIRHQLRKEVVSELSQDLNRSVVTFHSLQTQRIDILDRQNALLAELPTLKALMTSGDDLTIRDGAAEFWHLSGTDLFILVDPSGRAIAVYGKGVQSGQTLQQGLSRLLNSPGRRYLIHQGSLYTCAVRPLFFGNENSGTLLGYLITGVSADRTVRQISQPTDVEAAFLSGDQIVASTLGPDEQSSLALQSRQVNEMSHSPQSLQLGNSNFLSTTEDFSSQATGPLRLIVLKSVGPAEQSISRINRMVLIVGLIALFSGTGLMVLVSRPLTEPLEELSRSVKAFGHGKAEFQVPRHGTREVRQLGVAFTEMRKEIRKANQAVLESERLATIGRMASSISHDLRHYLAAIYANSEFLATDRLTAEEKADISADIRTAVNETADMIESLLIFSRTGTGIRRQPELVTTLLERAMAVIRVHPDAQGVKLVTHWDNPAKTAILADGKQFERAITNLLLNACQSARTTGPGAHVEATIQVEEHEIAVNIIDNGPGVPEKIRETLFQPFVSEGKQKGTGLGLTLANCIAKEHGGEVVLLSSRAGETIFQIRVARNTLASELADTSLTENAVRGFPNGSSEKNSIVTSFSTSEHS